MLTGKEGAGDRSGPSPCTSGTGTSQLVLNQGWENEFILTRDAVEELLIFILILGGARGEREVCGLNLLSCQREGSLPSASR